MTKDELRQDLTELLENKIEDFRSEFCDKLSYDEQMELIKKAIKALQE